MSMDDLLLQTYKLANQILYAGNAITAFSLLLYALTFNLRDRVARTLTLLLGCIAIAYSVDVFAAISTSQSEIETLFRLQWIGISFVPAGYAHFSDALLAATGRPSRGKRRVIIILGYVLALGFSAMALFSDLLVGDLVVQNGAYYLSPGPLIPIFLFVYLLCILFTSINLYRAYLRCLTTVSQRRMRYLMIGSLAPFLATFPFLTLTDGGLAGSPLLFWFSLTLLNILVAILIVLMTYSVAYFGVSVPDRIVKSRLFQWILRGPVVASSVLAVTVFVNRITLLLGFENSRAVLFSMVLTLLILQFVITLVRPSLERRLFYGEDREDVIRLQLLEDRLLTTGDLKQFLESSLNATCDLTNSESAFIAVIGSEGLELEVAVGPHDPLRGSEELPTLLTSNSSVEISQLGEFHRWDQYWVRPLQSSETPEVIGLIGIRNDTDSLELEDFEVQELYTVWERISVALTDRILQREIFGTVDLLMSDVEAIQRIRAAARYGGTDVLIAPIEGVHSEADLSELVRQALGHYWGGPRLMNSPLLRLQIVRENMDHQGGNPVNALREILRKAIERVRPEGERRFTADWMLYNILEMKFLEGRKVRDVAMRLAMSEADLYRKQRVAIEAVAREVVEMEREAMERAPE